MSPLASAKPARCIHGALFLVLAFVSPASLALSTDGITKQYLPSAIVDVRLRTVTLPLYRGSLASSPDAEIYYIVTDASRSAAASQWGANFAQTLAAAINSPAAQQVTVAGGGGAAPGSLLTFPGTIVYDRPSQITREGDSIGAFPPTSFSLIAIADALYSPLAQLPDGTVLNAPHVAFRAGPGQELHHTGRIISFARNFTSVTMDMSLGFSQGKLVAWLPTDASHALAASAEWTAYVPGLAQVAAAAVADMVIIVNGQTGFNNPQRQGIQSMGEDGLPPLNIAAFTPDQAGYSPLAGGLLALWVTPQPGPRQTCVEGVRALVNAGDIVSYNTKSPSESGPPLVRSGEVINVPIIAHLAISAVEQPAHAAAAPPMGEASCSASSLGYQCSVTIDGGPIIHYSLGGAATPGNLCTGGGERDAAGPNSFAHFAMQSVAGGYLALGFPDTPGRMWPATAVVGTLDSHGNASVQAYLLSAYSAAPLDASAGMTRRAGFMVSSGGSSILCFSRRMEGMPSAGGGVSVPPLRRLAAETWPRLALNWATSEHYEFGLHNSRGSLILDLNSGSATMLEDEDKGDRARADAARYAHGALMAAAFVLLMPGAALLPRHRWLFPDAADRLPLWFQPHVSLQLTATACACVGTVTIFAVRGWPEAPPGSGLYSAHRTMGLAVMAAAMVQVGLGVSKALLGRPGRPPWRDAHVAWGWATLVPGTAAAYTGIVLLSQLTGAPLTPWLAPALTVTLVLLGAALLLEVWHKQLLLALRNKPGPEPSPGR